MVKVASWQRPSSAPAPPQGAPDSPGWLSAPRGEAGPLSAQPSPRVLELATSKAAHVTAFDHVALSAPLSASSCLKLPQAPASLGRSAAWAALAGPTI
eukprot:scaffold100552_cov54-Phaeocystis_antarctica.AAC.2